MMCFSAPASFTASAALAVIGTLVVARTRARCLLAISIIPWFFAIQQFAEGLVWLHYPDVTYSKNIFLFFAYVFWPIWIPFSLLAAEKMSWRKCFLGICLGIGLVVGSAFSLTIPQTVAVVDCHSIRYLQNLTFTEFDIAGVLFYAISSVLPLFLSSLKRMWIVGLLVAGAGSVVFIIDREFFVSLWCFFAALISLSFLFVVERSSKS